jgi:UDP-GlcNAc:undecaprenyl-phosphate GlcNAc-1-phosphate transferase
MGHSDVHAVLLFYSWTAVVSIGCLLFMFFDAIWGVMFIIVGLVVCAGLTLAPLTRRKAVEASVQLASADDEAEGAVARFDPLDEAANDAITSETSTKEAS